MPWSEMAESHGFSCAGRRQMNFAFGLGIFHRVIEQIVDDFLQAIFVRGDHRQIRRRIERRFQQFRIAAFLPVAQNRRAENRDR